MSAYKEFAQNSYIKLDVSQGCHFYAYSKLLLLVKAHFSLNFLIIKNNVPLLRKRRIFQLHLYKATFPAKIQLDNWSKSLNQERENFSSTVSLDGSLSLLLGWPSNSASLSLLPFYFLYK